MNNELVNVNEIYGKSGFPVNSNGQTQLVVGERGLGYPNLSRTKNILKPFGLSWKLSNAYCIDFL